MKGIPKGYDVNTYGWMKGAVEQPPKGVLRDPTRLRLCGVQAPPSPFSESKKMGREKIINRSSTKKPAWQSLLGLEVSIFVNGNIRCQALMMPLRMA